MPVLSFPERFLWGAATSSYQIEGAVDADGRSESIWDRFAAKPGAIEDGSDGRVACDHFHRWPEDVALMKGLGLHSYRFSVAWPRIVPGGTGAVNQAGLDFYDRLVDGLLAAGIDPCVTLYHWDMPQVLEDLGGWPRRQTADAFVHYASAVAERLGDRVKFWITHNEPWCAAILGYLEGIHAPGRKDKPAALAAAHHMLLSHGMAVPVIRAASPGAKVGITLNLVDAQPASPSDADMDACRHFDGSFNRWFLDPLYVGSYPEDIVKDCVERGELPADNPLPFVLDGDMEIMGVPTDFLGINYYSRGVLRSDAVSEEDNLPRVIPEAPEETKTDIGWEVYPDGLYNLLARVHETYAPGPLYVTENGAAYHTAPDEDGRIRDTRRIEYVHGHLVAAHRAIEDGIPLAGYFLWSLMDNYEWSFGYNQRFGIVWVDYETLERTPKDSALWYRDVIARNGVLLQEEAPAKDSPSPLSERVQPPSVGRIEEDFGAVPPPGNRGLAGQNMSPPEVS